MSKSYYSYSDCALILVIRFSVYILTESPQDGWFLVLALQINCLPFCSVCMQMGVTQIAASICVGDICRTVHSGCGAVVGNHAVDT